MEPFFARVDRDGFSWGSRVGDDAPSSWVLSGPGGVAVAGGDTAVLPETWLCVGALAELVRRDFSGSLLSGRIDGPGLGSRFEACAFAHELIRSEKRLEGSPIEVWFARMRRVMKKSAAGRRGRAWANKHRTGARCQEHSGQAAKRGSQAWPRGQGVLGCDRLTHIRRADHSEGCVVASYCARRPNC